MLPNLLLCFFFVTDTVLTIDVFNSPNTWRWSKPWWRKDAKDDGLILSLNSGRIRGRKYVTKDGNTAKLFLGVPYAEPPTGNRRFQDPEPIERWYGIRDTKSSGPACWQNSTSSSYHPDIISEDCLYLNIFTPESPRQVKKSWGWKSRNEKYPVLVYIHGGGWEYDSPRQFPVDTIVDNLVSRGIVVVMVSFRLGIFGFFNTGDMSYSGNYGYKDIVLGLKWLQQEASAFGADPSKVTIMGHSSGATTVGHMAISPATKGLFQQAIELSGIGTGDITVQTSSERFKATAEYFGCNGWDTRNFDAVVQCLRQQPVDQIGNAYLYYAGQQDLQTLPRIDGSGGVLPDPLDKLRKSRLPISLLIGTTSNEFPLVPRSGPTFTPPQVSELCEEVSLIFGGSSFAEACSYFYNQDLRAKLPGDAYNASLKSFLSDIMFNAPTFSEADSARKADGRVFLYSFDYVKKEFNETSPSHVFDLTFIFGLHPFKFNDEDLKIQKIYLDLLADFIKTGIPTSSEGKAKWKPLTSPVGFNYYSINLALQNKEFFHFYPVQFWNRIVPYLQRSQQTGLNNALFVDLMKQAEPAADAVNAAAASDLKRSVDTASEQSILQNSFMQLQPEPPIIDGVSETKEVLSPFTVVGWTVFAITLYAFAAIFASYVGFVRGRNLKRQEVAVEQTPLIDVQRSYSTF